LRPFVSDHMCLMKKLLLIASLLIFCASSLTAQTGVVKGKVKNELNETIPKVKVEVLETELLPRYTNAEGEYYLRLKSEQKYRIRFTHPTHDTSVLEIRVLPAYTHNEPITMRTLNVTELEIIGQARPTDMNSEEQMEVAPVSAEDAGKMALVTSAERLIAAVTGGSNNEFSSQYQVRGGNFDENLVYVNGIEIYRPFLARAGQQEGLGFSNLNLTQEIKFSTGGFSARYGDRLSSVLDITYRDPDRFRGTVEAGLLTNSLHLEGSVGKQQRDSLGRRPGKFTYLLGARYFSFRYLLNSLESAGNYQPNFGDFQGMFTYVPRRSGRTYKEVIRKDGTLDTVYLPLERFKITSFFALSRNNYLFLPEARQTTFGTIQQAFRLRVAAEGREFTRYTTGLGAVMFTHRPNTRLKFDYTFTAYRAQEAELFDVEGGYLLSEVNTNFGSDEFGEEQFTLGIGTLFNHARNYLTINVLSGQGRGEWTVDKDRRHRLYFGAKYVHQEIEDDLKEYAAKDSAGYFIDSLGQFGLEEYIRGISLLKNNTYKAYLQHRWQISPRLVLNYGLRTLYFDQTDELLLAPRGQLIYNAKFEGGEPKLRLRLAAGVYHQPPLYREFRRLDGTLNLNVKSQRSTHFIAGLDYQFLMWNRDFRFFSEIYYKDLRNLIPYEVQNVRLRYYPDKVARGYATGIDARLHGQFIKGVDSWVSVNLLSTQEDVEGDTLGFVRRPTDQRFSFSMYFQDELPINPTYKVHVSYIYGSGLRFGPPREFEQRTNFGFPAYHRVDLGFSKVFAFKKTPKRGVESIWATLEIFNLLQRANTVSYLWIRDLENRQFAVPNNLSARLLNFRLVVKFR
jgi:hypothetical protein